MKTTFSKQLLLLAALLLAGVNSASAQFVRGDVNGDSSIDITDVTTLVDYIHGKPFPKASRTITFETQTSVAKTYGDAAFTNAATPSAGADDGTLTYSSSETSVATVDESTGEVTIVGVGEATITASITAGDTYAAASNTYTLTVTAASISPTVSLTSWTYGTPNNPSVSGNTGNGTVTYYYKVKDAADDTYSETKPTTVGNYTVKASIAATTNYQAAETTPVDFSIGQKEITVTGGITAGSKVYDGTTTATLVLTGATFDGVVGGDNVTVASATGTFDNENVGTGKTVTISGLTLGGTDVANYKLATSGNQASTTADITAASFTPVVTLAGWTYGSPNAPSVGETNTSGGTVTYYYKTGDADWTETQPTDVGTHKVKASIAANGNYAAEESAAVEFTITAATISNVTIAELSAPVKGDALDTEASCSTSGIASVGTVSWTTGGENATGNAAANTVYTASVTLTANSNYVFAANPTANAISGKDASVSRTDDTHITVSYTFDATAKNDLSLTLSLTGWTYGTTANTTPTLTGNDGSGTVTYQYKLTSADDNTYATFDASNYPTDAGDYTLKATVAANGDYNAGSATTTFSIAKADATLTCDNATLSFAASDAANSTKTKTGVSCTGGTITVQSSNTSNCTVSYSEGTITVTRVSTGGWEVTITVSVTPDANHNAPESVTFTVAGTASTPANAISGKFSVSDSKQVYFSKGNLKYNGSTWSFFDNQYDYYTTHDGTNWDKFGWSTSTTTYGMNTSTSNSSYTGNFVDWGSNSSLQSTLGSGWSTLSSTEWTYVFTGRPGKNKGSTVGSTNYASYTHAAITISGTTYYGMILFPDGGSFTASEASWGTINGNSAWSTTCTEAQWSALESKGCVFLPAAGYRNGTSVYSAGSHGSYWSSTANGTYGACSVNFFSGYLLSAAYYYRYGGYSVRLVRQVE